MILFLLFVFASWSALADVVCIQNSNYSWTCSGTGVDSRPEYPGIVVTNGVGVCTNCLQMTVSECETLKGRLKSRVNDIRNEVSATFGPVFALRSQLGAFTTKWNEMQIQSYAAANRPPEYASNIQWFRDQPQVDYVLGSDGSPPASLTAAGPSLNSIANFYLQEVQPLVNKIDSEISSAESRFRSLDTQFTSYSSFVDTIPCEECKLDPDSSAGGGGGSGGDSGGGGSGGDCCGPCVEQLQALNQVASTIESRLQAIGYSVDSVSTNLSALSKSLEGYLISLTNSLSRIDSFVTSDLANSMRQLTNSLVVIERNVDGVQRDFYLAMSNAQHFVSLGDKEWNPVEISTNFFEVGEYKDLPWASRVEALLLNLTQPFDSSSTPDGVTRETMDEVVEKVSELQTAVDPASLSSAYSSQFEKVQRAFSSFNGLFQGDSTGTLNFGKIGDYDLTFQLDASVVGVCRTVFSLIWYCTALVALFFIVPFLWSLSLGSFKFLWHLLTLLVK